MNILEERKNLKQIIKRIDWMAAWLEREKLLILHEQIELQKNETANKKEIDLIKSWIRCDLPFARLVHCLDLPEDKSPFRRVKESRHVPLRCSYVDLYLDGSARLFDRDGKPTCCKDLEEVIGFFYCL